MTRLPPATADDLVRGDLGATLERDEALWNGLRGTRLFITGGTGFVGKWLLESFVHANERLALGASAMVLSRDPRRFGARHPRLFGAPCLEWLGGDVRDFIAPPGAFSHAIHAATDVLADAKPLDTFQVIVGGTQRVLDFCRERRVRDLLLVSSGAVYGRQRPDMDRVDESHPSAPSTTAPESAYGEGKRVAEWLATTYARDGGPAVHIARCFAFVGPYLPLDRHFAVGNFIADRLAGRHIEVRGDGTAVRSYLYGADMARWLWTILLRGRPGEAYNVGSEEGIGIGALARRIAAMENGGEDVRIGMVPAPGALPERYVPDTRKACTELGLEPLVPLDEAISRTLWWHMRNARSKPDVTPSREPAPQENAFRPAALRKTVLRMARAGSSVHIGCAFSIIEILAVLYRNHLRGQCTDQNRDYLVLSKGHGVMAQYACLHEAGILGDDDMDKYFGDCTRLKGLSDAHVPGCEVTSGTLGHGLSVGVGLALAARRKKTAQRCYAIVGDGEMNEGPIWEAMQFAAHFRLENLVVIVDENRFQAMGTTEEVMALGDLKAKFEAFGFDARAVDGHDEGALDAALNELKAVANGRPKAIVARTVKGKGVSFMENDNRWHYTRLTEETYRSAMQELELQ